MDRRLAAILAAAMREVTLERDLQFSANVFVKWQGLSNKDHQKRLLSALLAARLPE